MSHLVSAYLDTSFIVAEMFPPRDRREHVSQVVHDLFDNVSLVLISDLTRIELAQAFKVVANDPWRLSEVERRRHRLHRWGDLRDVRSNWYELCFTRLDAFLSSMTEVRQVAVTGDVIESAREHMAPFQLNSYDAVHVAVAVGMNARVLITLDRELSHVSEALGIDVIVV